MSLNMTADEFHESYPDGMDSEDLAAWNLAVDREADDCECVNAEDGFCPDCGYDAIQAAEQRIGA